MLLDIVFVYDVEKQTEDSVNCSRFEFLIAKKVLKSYKKTPKYFLVAIIIQIAMKY